MEQVVIKKDLIRITSDFTLGVILNEMIEIAQKFRKEFIDNNWHCPEFFELNIEKISEDNMLNLSKSSIRRYIKKLTNLGFINVDTTEKKHRYKVNFEEINIALKKIGGELIEKVKPVYKKAKKENKKTENSKNTITNTVDEFEGFTQTNMFEYKKIAPDKNQELNETIIQIQNNINYNIIEEMRQDRKNEHFVNMFDSIYRVIVDVMTTKGEYIRINKQDKPISIVRDIFNKIGFSDIEDIIYRLKRASNKIKNFKAYILTSIYNQYIEKDFNLNNMLYTNEGVLLK